MYVRRDKQPYRLINFLIHALCTSVAISNRIADDLAGLIEEDKINAPGIDADALGNAVKVLTLLKPFDDLLKEMLKIPAKMTVLFYKLILEAVNFLYANLSFINPAKDMTTARSADIYRQIILYI